MSTNVRSGTREFDEEGFHEIQLSGKQLVFLCMATTVVSIVIFLCGVLVGRGVRPVETIAEAASANTAGDPVVRPPVVTPPAPAPTTAGKPASPAAAVKSAPDGGALSPSPAASHTAAATPTSSAATGKGAKPDAAASTPLLSSPAQSAQSRVQPQSP